MRPLNIQEISAYQALGVECPPPAELVRGAIIGTVYITDVIRRATGKRKPHPIERSPWFFGPVGLVLEDPAAVEPIPIKGSLGFFDPPSIADAIEEPKPWMTKPRPSDRWASSQEGLI